jgi:GT2 family glycosyltransferase
MAKLSAIIATRNRPQELVRCVESIFAQTLLPDELVVVDASDVPEVKPKLESITSMKKMPFKYITSRPHMPAQRNLGVDNASGDIIMIIDDDTIFDRNYFAEIVSVFNSDVEGRVGGVFGESTEGRADANKAIFIRRIFTKLFGTVFFLYCQKNGKFQPSGAITTIQPATMHDMTEVECFWGNFFAMRKETFNEFRLEEGFPYNWFADDDDLAYRVSRKYKNIYNPRAKLAHHRSTARFDPQTTMRVLMENHYFFYQKNLPKTLKHRAAFWWSIVGWLLRELIVGLVKWDFKKLSGSTAGFANIMKNKLNKPIVKTGYTPCKGEMGKAQTK